ncbi:unnamed protein product [Schistosoma turkestanicum]|nr:unnamed protein product [Schistosoma turkestanicum]
MKSASSYQIPVSKNNNNNNNINTTNNNERLNRMNLLSNSAGNLSSTRNTPCLRSNSLSSATNLNETLHNTTPTSHSSGCTSGNESNGNHALNMTFGSNSRIVGNCAECGLRIGNLTEACYAMGYLYHNSCFVCCCCKRTLRGKVFYKDQDKIYCEEDYLYCGFQQTVEKCFACGHIIAETILLANGNTYHPGCFRCCICTKCLDGIPFTIDSNNLIYCLTDYHLIHGPLCSVCGLVIMPDEGTNEVKRVVALGKEFHIDCYRCVDCKRNLSDEADKRCYPLKEPDPVTSGRIIQRLLCLNCHLQRIGAIPATSASGCSNINIKNHNTTNILTPTTPTTNISVSSNHLKSNNGSIMSHPNTTSTNHISNTRYATLPNRLHGMNKLNTITNPTSTTTTTNNNNSNSNNNQYIQPHQHHHSSPSSHHPNVTSSTLLTHSYSPRSQLYTTANSSLHYRNTTNNDNHSNNTNINTNNYAMNWEKTRTNGLHNPTTTTTMTNNTGHNGHYLHYNKSS